MLLESPCEEYAWDLDHSKPKYFRCVRSYKTHLVEGQIYLAVRHYKTVMKVAQRSHFDFLKDRFVPHTFKNHHELVEAFKPKLATGFVLTSVKHKSKVFGTDFKFRYIKKTGDKFYWKKFNTIRDLYRSDNNWVRIPEEYLEEVKIRYAEF
jgi:hypothetical protein